MDGECGPIRSVEVLTRDECMRLVESVHRLRPHWLSRGMENSVFFTLGAASYLDEEPRYGRYAAAKNRLLALEFGWLYERLRTQLSALLRAPVEYAEDFALPSFHIWRGQGIFTAPNASIHFDVQYERRDWRRFGTPDLTQPLSFTLPIKLPGAGGGLNFWNVTHDQVCAFWQRTGASVSLGDLTLLLERRRHDYRPGVMALHSGLMLHQIAEVASAQPDDERITLQGHGMRCGDRWLLYW